MTLDEAREVGRGAGAARIVDGRTGRVLWGDNTHQMAWDVIRGRWSRGEIGMADHEVIQVRRLGSFQWEAVNSVAD